MWWFDVSVLHKGLESNVEKFVYEARDWSGKKKWRFVIHHYFHVSWTWEPQALRHEGELTNRPAGWAGTCRTTNFLWGSSPLTCCSTSNYHARIPLENYMFPSASNQYFQRLPFMALRSTYWKFNTTYVLLQGANKVKRATKDVISALKNGCGWNVVS